MTEGQGSFRVSVDVGGTFTDLVALSEESGDILNIKVSTVPRNPEEGVMTALSRFLEGREPSSIKMVGHATTIATNALFGQVDLELPKTALITTKGFRDVVEIGRQRRAEVYNLFFRRPRMLVERRHRYEVEERMGPDGSVLVPLSITDVEEALEDMEAEGVESLAIGFLNSYTNQSHEEEVLRMAEERLPNVRSSSSSRLSGGYREYERFSTAVVNAALVPIIHTYISQLAKDLEASGVGAPLYVMQSNGGMATAKVVSDRPVTIVESGPSSGVIAAAWLGELVGRPEVISFDMGGTTAKAGTIRGRVPEVVSEYEVAGKVHMGRLLKGSGYPVSFPFIDLAECSAGGGTIAWTDKGGALNVGPVSAGANPGPACYGTGGTEPTITDANLMLGRLNPQSLLDGGMPVYQRNARAALELLGGKLEMGVDEVAASVVRIANSIMSKILRIVSVERGFDPRRFALVAFGGAGPMHACPLAEELGIGEIVIPPNPGMFSAMGLLTADIFHDYSRAMVRRACEVDPAAIEGLFMEMEGEGRETLMAEGVETVAMRFQRQLDLRYLGQSYELAVNVASPFDSEALASGVKAFHNRHKDVYGYATADEPVELVNIRLRAIGMIQKPQLKENKTSSGSVTQKDQRLVFFEGEEEWVETPIFDRRSLVPGANIGGPSIIEQYDSTTVVYPGWIVSVDKYGIITLRRGGE
ncbi:MAG: hydantoinase/oxoprolinase family protein [Candidatus Bathyarchaeota archaeon]|nr:hydantoinase/oxoprolinase family protein [Candidatus Bathyarchaeota archaeon]